MNHLVQRLREKSRLGYWPLLGDEAADEIERLQAELANVNNEFGSQTADWPDAWKRVAELKQLSNDRWREAERLRAALNDIAQHQDSEWPLRCRMNVRTARAALKEPT